MSPTPPRASPDPHPPHIDSPRTLRHIPLTFDNANADQSALELVHEICPQWALDDGPIEFIRFTEGITNTLTKAVKRRPGQTKSQIDQDAILLRAYGQGTELLINRERELRAHGLLADVGLAPALLAKFENGLLYRFVEGEVCTPEDLRKPKIYRQVAKRLGQWHGSLPVTPLLTTSPINGHADHKSCNSSAAAKSLRPIPNPWTVMESWLEALPSDTAEQKQRIQVLGGEVAEVTAKLANTPGLLGKDYIFGHCDLLCGNVIVSPRAESGGPTNGHSEDDERPVDFIDYEYAAPSPAAFDLANHFAEWAGLDCEYGAVPTRSQRREFLQHYVASFYAHSPGKETTPAPSDLDKDIDTLFAQVDDFRGIPGLFWGIWALIQAQISEIDFDYASYAELRLSEYWSWKAETDGSRARDGKEIPVRERRWAEE
ncbi:ethanolamine kinase [Dissoconium aciculare CBS 342.82]|uniref:ethanolamine kinase n=1 Tax=Dissoconium aciculare CBS 342.82 TaxID=1314786 RepID=A0A6J3MGY6_9PEZI|nr:ethanolamine kinase [Dissoconium aciculare CBS 342.82]KAF1826162.1 ethanolamine kinase [Dissoconium aciculare CBS 342.82]